MAPWAKGKLHPEPVCMGRVRPFEIHGRYLQKIEIAVGIEKKSQFLPLKYLLLWDLCLSATGALEGGDKAAMGHANLFTGEEGGLHGAL